MDLQKCTSLGGAPSTNIMPVNSVNMIHTMPRFEEQKGEDDHFATVDVDVDPREVYFLIMHFLSTGPCQKTFRQLWGELLEHELLPRRYHAWYSRSGNTSGAGKDDGISFPLNYDNLVNRYPHIEGDHLIKLLRQLMLRTALPLRCIVGKIVPSASDVPTLLGSGPFSLLSCHRNSVEKEGKPPSSYLRWPHMQADQVRGLALREIGGGFPKHHRAPSIRFACYAVAKPSTMVQKMQNIKKLRGHRNAVYCAIFDRSGRYVITGSDDRLVKIWSMETAYCLSSCRGHEGDITDLAVSSNNIFVASSSNDYSIRVWRLPDGYPISVLLGHAGAVTAIAFCPRPTSFYQLLSSSDDGTCRIWDARSSSCTPRVYLPKPTNAVSGRSGSILSANLPSSHNASQSHQILCCAYNANGTVFVTGSSDTYARVWNAGKANSEDPELPSHEIDILAGHENDVNYVQFSGCAVVSRTSASDCSMVENIPKFKNSWFSHDNIVTCSRDGSAIIWTPKSRRSQGKLGRWIRAYHLKVPPPPMPPQPRRGGPRQRYLPTPRGVNMIMWSLDNRFVLAAIMDCRICVWNASDGSLVHSLTGHTASTYVLDVHPFNPRIAMSAGYDGKTIVWDIWEGIPIWVYEIGRFKLVDGKFSQDGTSIILSDDVGQIYLLNTGQGESQKDAKYDQFFLGDYRPLVRDPHGYILDQETQLAPHVRNSQDLLCDSSMLPYPEPYQSMYQHRRLGALGIEWRPSSVKLAIGPDIGLGQEYQLLPLADLDMVVEPLPEFVEAMFLEPENDVIQDETDSEYFVTDEFSSEDEPEHLSDSSSSEPENVLEEKSGQGQRDRLRKLKRKKPLPEVELTTSSGRRVRKRILDKHEGTSSRSRGIKKSGNRRKSSSKRNYVEVKSLRPQRAAARNAINGLSQISEISTSGEEEEEEEGSEEDSSESGSLLQGTYIKNKKHVPNSQNQKHKLLTDERVYLNESKDAEKCLKHIDHKTIDNKKRLVLKLSIRNSSKPGPSESTRTDLKNQAVMASFLSGDSGPSSCGRINSISVEDCNGLDCVENEEPKSTLEDLGTPASCQASGVSWGEVKPRTGRQMPSGDLIYFDLDRGARGSSTEDHTYEASVLNKEGGVKEYFSPLKDIGNSPVSNVLRCQDPERIGSDSGFSFNQISVKQGSRNHSSEPNEIQKPKPTILKIKSKKVLQDFTTAEVPGSNGYTDLGSEYPFPVGHNLDIRIPEGDRNEFSEGTSHTHFYNQEEQTEFPDIATDAMRRKRSLRLKATSRESSLMNPKHKVSDIHLSLSPSRATERHSKRLLDPFPTRGMQNSKPTTKISAQPERISPNALRKSNWLLLTEQEQGYRYIPQLGDEVVYLVQGHQQYLDSSQSSEKTPTTNYGVKIKATEICMVKSLEYSAYRGSGESCCKITLKFSDSSSALFGQSFQFTLPELNDSSDFVVEKTWYHASMRRNWACRDKCLVWWKDANGEGGSWWEGQIMSLKDRSPDFPNSPWERFVVSYKSDPTEDHRHSPWELHDPDIHWEHPQIDVEIRDKILSYLNRLLKSASKNEDCFGVLKLEDVSQKDHFINRFPVPLSLDIVQLRLENSYYRTLDSVKHDIRVILSNGESYFVKNRELSVKMKLLSEWFSRKLLKL